MIFGKKIDYDFMYNNKCLDIVQNYKYLGVLFNSVSRCNSNIFTDAYTHIANQARKAMFKVLKDTKSIGVLPPDVALKLFDSLVLPILEYSSEIWFRNKEINEIESIQIKFIKTILGVHGNTSNLAVLGETGRFPLVIRQKVKSLKYWSKILTLPDHSLVKKMYFILYDLNEAGYQTWCTNIEEMLCQSDLKVKWDQQHCDNNTIKYFNDVLQQKYVNYWYESINDNILHPKLRTYCQFKKLFCMEPYLLNITDFKLRRQLSKFRLSNHNLHIEKGRHVKPKTPVEERLRNICKRILIEDEFHFICVCEQYTDLRDYFFNKIIAMGFYGNHFKLEDILNFSEGSLHLAKFLTKMFKKRKCILED